MAITKKPPKKMETRTGSSAVDAFVSGAPDAAAAPRRVQKGRKVQITLTISEPLLNRVDNMAGQLGQSRAAVINLAVVQMLESGLNIESSVY